MNEKYLLKVSIDFGSTNTVMVWRVYEVDENGRRTISETLNSTNNVYHIPSIMLFKDDNPGNHAIIQDCYGEQAERIIRDSNTPPVVCDNFKQYLYVSTPESPEFQKGVDLTTKYFSFLREKFVVDIYNKLPNYVRKEMKAILYLSTPVRAAAPHLSIMRKIATEAGFTEVNGIHEICTDYDEARCVVRYAMEDRKDAMQDILVKAGQPGGAILLFVDVGGSTMDVSLQNLRIGLDGTETMDPISFWPDADVKYPLGGCLVDRAIMDYLVQEGFANPEYTVEKWDHGDGKFRFRVFKEENNEPLSMNEEISRLGRLTSVCYDRDEDIYPERNYNTCSQKINADVFENQICGVYIDHIVEAFRQVFLTNQRPLENRPFVTPADVDAIFLAGAGSRLYFISKLLLGECERNGQMIDLDFTQIKANRNLLFNKWEDPSRCCAIGALVEQENVVSPNYARDNYYVKIRLYEHNATLPAEFQKNPNIPNPECDVYVDETGKEFRYKCIYDRIQILTPKYAMLPAGIYENIPITYLDTCYSNMAVQMILCRVNDNGEEEAIGLPYFKSQPRKLGPQLLEFTKTVVGLIPGLAAIGVGYAADGILGAFGKKTKIGDWVEQGVSNYMEPKNTVTLNLSYSCILEANNMLRLEAEISSRFFRMESNKIVMDV